MPNNVLNKLRIEGPKFRIQEVWDFLRTTDDDGETHPISFNKLVPMPKSLKCKDGSYGDLAYRVLFKESLPGDMWLDEDNEEEEKFYSMSRMIRNEATILAHQYRENILKYGHKTWYGWSITNWGTKWDAYDQMLDGDTLMFNTAWSGVPKIIEKISEKFPDLTLHYQFADEDIGCNVGDMTFYGGRCVDDTSPKNQTKAAYDLAFELRPGANSYYRLVNGEWKYDDDWEINQ